MKIADELLVIVNNSGELFMTLRAVEINDNNLSSFFRWVNTFPILSEKEEMELIYQWQETKNKEAIDLLVGSHLRLVLKIALGFKGYGFHITDLISEGNVGLVMAINRFDLNKSNRLSTYATWWIRAYIQEYILHNWSLVKMGTTAAQKKLFFNLRKVKSRLELMDDDAGLSNRQLSAIAEELDVPENEVYNMNQRMSGPDHSLNAEVFDDGIGEWQDWLIDKHADQEDDIIKSQELAYKREVVLSVISCLTDREKDILAKRRIYEPALTLEEISQQYDISRERVRQIEVKAIKKLQKEIKNYLSENTNKTVH